MKTWKKTGRLAFREEGEFWVAYYSALGTMVDAIPLGTIRMRFVGNNKKRRAAFMKLMKEAFGDIVEEVTGDRPRWPEGEKPAPDHERSRE